MTEPLTEARPWAQCSLCSWRIEGHAQLQVADWLREHWHAAHEPVERERMKPCPWCGHPPMCHKGPEGECVKEADDE